jgi:hypothetical protein
MAPATKSRAACTRRTQLPWHRSSSMRNRCVLSLSYAARSAAGRRASACRNRDGASRRHAGSIPLRASHSDSSSCQRLATDAGIESARRNVTKYVAPSKRQCGRLRRYPVTNQVSRTGSKPWKTGLSGIEVGALSFFIPRFTGPERLLFRNSRIAGTRLWKVELLASTLESRATGSRLWKVELLAPATPPAVADP